LERETSDLLLMLLFCCDDGARRRRSGGDGGGGPLDNGRLYGTGNDERRHDELIR